jgi:LysR family cyn operon transcriptional activator
MELRQLKYFAKVAELCSFSRAAKELYVSQSSLSQQIRQLEVEVGATLLVRDSHSVVLSDTGRAFLPSALRTLAEAEKGMDSIRNIKGLSSGVLTIGSTFTFSLLLERVVREFASRYPGVKVRVVCRKMDELMQMLEQGEIDVALSYRHDGKYPNIESTTLFDNHLVVALSKTHPLALSKCIALSELQKHRLALPMRGMQARNAFEKLVEGRNLDFNIQVEMDDITMLLNLVASTRLLTLVSQATATQHPGLVGIPIDGHDVAMEGCYHVLKEGYLKHAAAEFIRLLEENKTLGIIEMM